MRIFFWLLFFGMLFSCRSYNETSDFKSPFVRRTYKKKNIKVSKGFWFFKRSDDWDSGFGKKKNLFNNGKNKFSPRKSRFKKTIKGTKNKKEGSNLKSKGGRKE